MDASNERTKLEAIIREQFKVTYSNPTVLQFHITVPLVTYTHNYNLCLYKEEYIQNQLDI